MSRRRTSRWLAILSAIFIVYGTTIPFRFLPNRRLIAAKWHRLTFNPLHPTTSGRSLSIPDAAQNILLFFPFGIFAAGAKDPARPARRRFIAVVFAGAALSTAVESLQLIDIGRTASFADVVTNTIGTALGAVISPTVLGALTQLVRRLKQRGALDAPSSFPLLVGVALVCLAAWAPFDVTLDIGVGWHKLTALAHDPWQADGAIAEALQMVRFFVLTIVVASWLRELHVQRAVSVAVAACGLLAIALELSQMLIESRLPGLVDVSMDLAGAAAGGLLFEWLGQPLASAMWFIPLAAATWLAAVVPVLSPYRLPVPSRPFWTMSLEYAVYSRAFPRHVFELLALCFPLGFALSWAVRRPSRAYLGAIAAALAVEGSIAALTRWARSSNPQALDVVVVVLGALGGAWLARSGWARFRALVGSLGSRAEPDDSPRASPLRRASALAARE